MGAPGAVLRAARAARRVPGAALCPAVTALRMALTALRAAGTSCRIPVRIAVRGSRIAGIGAHSAVIGAHIAVPFEKMPVFPAKHDVLARLHPFPEPLLLAMPWDSGAWDSGTWDSDALSAANSKPKKPMKRPAWFPADIGTQIVTLQNIKTKLPSYSATLPLVAGELTAALLDVDNSIYAIDAYRGGIATFSKAAYARVDEALQGGPAGNIAWLTFPVPGGAPVAVLYGCLQRVFTFIANKVQTSPGYTDAIAFDLGLKVPPTPGLPPAAVPVFSLRLTTGDKLEVVWTKGQSEGVKLQFNLGAAGTQDDIDTRPNYTLNWLPAAGQSAVIQVRLAYLLKDGTTGSWSDWKSFTLTGA